jgi:hypothetical protein
VAISWIVAATICRAWARQKKCIFGVQGYHAHQEQDNFSLCKKRIHFTIYFGMK